MLLRLATRIADRWIGRYARPNGAAQAAVAGLRPVVLVTGGASGIGYALARRFAEAGCDIALVGRNPATLAAATGTIARDFGIFVVSAAQDIGSPDAASAIERHLRQAGAYVDVLVNCAGIGVSGDFATNEPARLDEMLATNVAALTRLSRYFLPAMLARGRGGMLNVASLGAYTPGPYQAAYYASKSYVLSLSEAIGHETAGRGVRVCAVAPGPVVTRFHADMQADGSPYRLLLPPASPQAIARAAYRGFALGRRVIVPGPIGLSLMLGARAMPHPLLLPIIAVLLRPWRRAAPHAPASPPAPPQQPPSPPV